MTGVIDEPPRAPWLRIYPEAVDWHAKLPARLLQSLLDDAVAKFGSRPFLDFMGRRYTYRAVGRDVDSLACGLQRLGVAKGVKVGLFLVNSPYSVIAYYAVLKAGGIVVNFNPLYAEREIAHQIEDSGTTILITVDLALLYAKAVKMLDQTRLSTLIVCPFARALPFPKSVLFAIARRRDLAPRPRDRRVVPVARLLAEHGTPTPADIDPAEDVAVLQYTGGTTGVPKGAMLTHANLYANAVQSALWFTALRPGRERILGVLPFFHVFAMTAIMNVSILKGAEIILLPRFDLGDVLRVIHRKKPTMLPAVPTIYTAINNHPRRSRYDLSSIKFCISGGAPLPTEVKLAFERNTGCVVVEGYGLSETSPVATCNPPDGINKIGSIGLPLPGTTIEIVSLDDRSRVLPPGERGEVCITGPQVMKGYWNQPAETADALADGRLHTGDVGYMDADGYTFIVDRIKDLILCSGYNVYPRNVEEAIYLHPAVAECVVAGLSDQYRGQTVKAYVKLAAGQTLTQHELIRFLADKLSPIEMPKLVEFRDELPKTIIGKLSRKALLEEEAARQTPPGADPDAPAVG